MNKNPFPAGSGPTAIVLNVSFAGLAAIRTLSRARVPVIGLDPDASHAGFVSRHGTSLVCPHPVREPDRLVDFLLEQGKKLDRPGVLSPASDGFVLFVSRYREALGEYFRYALPDPDVMESAVDKRGLYDLAAGVGYNHATTWYPETMDDVERIKDELDYPAFIKPQYSHLWQVHFPEEGKGIKVFGPDELERAFERILPTGVEVMVQSIIQGPASNVRTVYAYINGEGEPLGLLTTRKIRQFPMEFGRGSLAETFHDEELSAYGLEFFRRIGWRGFATIEFKKDDRDGLLKVTDLNARWVKPTMLPVTAGVNFPLLHYLDVAGQSPEPQMKYRAGVRWLDAIGDMSTSWTMYRRGELSPLQWARSLMGVRAFPAFAPDDMKPFLHEYDHGRRLARPVLRRLRRG